MAHRSRLPGCPCGKVKRVRALSVLIGRAYRYALAGSSTSEVCGECTFGWAYVPLRAPMIETILNLLGLAFTANLLGLAFIAGGAFICCLVSHHLGRTSQAPQRAALRQKCCVRFPKEANPKCAERPSMRGLRDRVASCRVDLPAFHAMTRARGQSSRTLLDRECPHQVLSCRRGTQWHRCLCGPFGEMLIGTTSLGGAVVFTSRARIQRYTKTGVFVCVRTLFVTLPSTTAESPLRPCDDMTMRSQPLSEAVAIMA